MGSLSDIKRRLESVKQTRRITCAMKTVSIAKMRKASENYTKSRAYVELLENIMTAAASGCEVSDFFDRNICDGKAFKKCVVVLSSDTGLCGGFDHDILRLADNVIDNDCVILPIGRVAAEYYVNHDGVDMRFAHCYSAKSENAGRLAKAFLEMFGKEVREITVVYGSMRKPTQKRLLPIPEQTASVNVDPSFFEPSREAVLGALVPLYLTAIVFDIMQCHIVSEHSARQAAMTSATDSADKLIDMLSIQYNRARQASVTGQITEIIGATTALANGGSNEKRS